MKHKKILTLSELAQEVKQIHEMRAFGLWPVLGFTNGCFDLFHAGHAHLLNSIKAKMGCHSKLIVAINSDASVRTNKGRDRPIIPHAQRAYQVACHSAVDYVFVFSEKTVGKYLKNFKPDVWYKGGDYQHSTLNSYESRIAKNNKTTIDYIPLLEGVSSTKIIEKLK